MVEQRIDYLGELRCEATHAPSGSKLLTDAPTDNHGKAEYFSPTDLVATALGTCILTTMGIVAAQKLKVSIDGASARVVKEMAAKPSRRIGAVSVVITVPGNFDDAQKAALERAANICPVHQSLHPDVSMPITFEWVNG